MDAPPQRRLHAVENARETLNNSEFPAAQGSAAIFNGCKTLKMKEDEKSLFFVFAAVALLDGLTGASQTIRADAEPSAHATDGTLRVP